MVTTCLRNEENMILQHRKSVYCVRPLPYTSMHLIAGEVLILLERFAYFLMIETNN